MSRWVVRASSLPGLRSTEMLGWHGRRPVEAKLCASTFGTRPSPYCPYSDVDTLDAKESRSEASLLFLPPTCLFSANGRSFVAFGTEWVVLEGGEGISGQAPSRRRRVLGRQGLRGLSGDHPQARRSGEDTPRRGR